MSFGFDFNIFWRAAAAILQGRSPYEIGGFFSPYPLALLLVPLALLPFAAAYGLWTGLQLFLLAHAQGRWGFLKSLLFFPVAFSLLQGQLDLLVFLLGTQAGWMGLVASTLRPQLAIWLIPFAAWQWWRAAMYDRFWKAGLGVGILYGVATLVDPGWWGNWLHASSVAWRYNQQSASLFGLASILPFTHLTVFGAVCLVAVASFVALRPHTPRSFWQWVALFNPAANVYSLVVLYDQVDWLVILLALAAMPLALVARTNAVWAIIPLYLILKDRLAPALQSRRALGNQVDPQA